MLRAEGKRFWRTVPPDPGARWSWREATLCPRWPKHSTSFLVGSIKLNLIGSIPAYHIPHEYARQIWKISSHQTNYLTPFGRGILLQVSSQISFQGVYQKHGFDHRYHHFVPYPIEDKFRSRWTVTKSLVICCVQGILLPGRTRVSHYRDPVTNQSGFHGSCHIRVLLS